MILWKTQMVRRSHESYCAVVDEGHALLVKLGCKLNKQYTVQKEQSMTSNSTC